MPDRAVVGDHENHRFTNQKSTPGKQMPTKASRPISICARKAFLRFSAESGEGGFPQSSSSSFQFPLSSFTLYNLHQPNVMPQEESTKFDRATIVGPGLLGASLGMGLWSKKVVREIWVWARNEKRKQECELCNWCDRSTSDLKEAVGQSDLVILCTPVDSIVDQLDEVARWSKDGCIVTDVGSLKEKICLRADEAFCNRGACFVGSHPMTGSEKTGMKNASPTLFEMMNCLVAPTADTSPDALRRIKGLWKSLGMKVTEVCPVKHDEVVGWISHLPHLTASALMMAVCRKNGRWLNLSGNGLRDTTRVAAGDSELWKQIILGNKKNLSIALGELIECLQGIKKTMERGNCQDLAEKLETARIARMELNQNG